MRRLWRNIHLWVGLTAGLVLVLIGLTGSAIVFYRYLEEQIYADSLLVENQGERISISQALESAEAQYNHDGTILGVVTPRHDEATFLAFRWRKDEAGKGTFSFVSIDPFSGAFLSERDWGKTVMTFIYKLHYTLTFGSVGAFIVGFIGIFFLITMFIGLYLWWPKAGKWKQALWFKKGASAHRRNFDIHRVFGFYPMIILVTIAFSGIYMIFPKEVKWVVSQVSALERDVEHETKIMAPENGVPISYEKAIAIAKVEIPDAEIVKFDRPHDEHHPVVVSFKDPNQPMTTFGYNQVFIEPYTGEVLYVKLWENSSNGDAFLAWQFPLHNGEAFGLVGRWLIFASGFLPAVLYTTGLLMWLKRRKKKKQDKTLYQQMGKYQAASA